MPQRDDRARKKGPRQQHPRLFREIPWLTIICPSDFNLDTVIASWMASRFLRDSKQGHTIRTSKAEGLISVFEDPYWTQLVIGLGNSQFNPQDGKLASETILEELNKLSNQNHFNGGALAEMVKYAKGNETLDKILIGTHINVKRMGQKKEVSNQETLLKFGYILDALYQAISEQDE